MLTALAIAPEIDWLDIAATMGVMDTCIERRLTLSTAIPIVPIIGLLAVCVGLLLSETFKV